MELTQQEIIKLLALPDMETIQGKRDYLILSMLCHGISKPRIARVKVFDFTVEREQLVFTDKKGKAYLSAIDRWVWDGYIRELVAKRGLDFVKTRPVLITFSTNKLKGGDKNFGITPEAIQQIVSKYFRKAGIDRKPSAGMFKQAKPVMQQKTTSEKKTPKGFIQKRGVACPRSPSRTRRNKRYRNRNRYPHYKHRLVENKFCFDANFLISKGFFRAGVQGLAWTYACSNKQNGFMGEARITLRVGNPRGDLAIRVEPESSLLTNPTTVRVTDEGCRLGGLRWLFYCPRCGKKVFTLFYHFVKGSWIENALACRRCHGLLYLSQVRGSNRVGVETFKQNKEQYRVIKSLCKNAT
jgi:hypothetical protein